MIQINGKAFPWRTGMTVSDLLSEMGDPHPYAVVRINEQRITRPFFDTTVVPDDSEIFLIPLIAGG